MRRTGRRAARNLLVILSEPFGSVTTMRPERLVTQHAAARSITPFAAARLGEDHGRSSAADGSSSRARSDSSASSRSLQNRS